MLLALIASCLTLSLALVGAGVVEDKYSCPHGWTRYGNKKCLKYFNELQDYERAQATCRSKNQGTLVTIHSHDEQNFVYSYIHSIAASSTPIWLGAKQIDFESILWLDKTENSYTNWAPSEPSHPDEICIALNPRNGMWHDVMCTEANVPACERAPTTQWPFFVAFCSEGWFQFNDEKCVRLISSQALNFYESQELCRSKYNSKLLSIKTDRESEFIHNLIKFRDIKLPVWLGAVQNDFSSFNWIDKTDVTFTNWADGEPNDPDHACLSMSSSGAKWADNDCKEQKLILCQKVVPEEGSCETGWLQFRQDKCYRFVHIRMAFDDAESLCNSLYGGHLPSVHSQEEQFMISQFLASVNVKNGSEIWLGGRQMDSHNFNWGDGSLFNYSYWEHGEPNFPAEKCIEMSWRNGRWNDISCRLKRAVLCERQVSSRHLVKPNLYQSTTCLVGSNCTAGIGQSSPSDAFSGTEASEPVMSTTGSAGQSPESNLSTTTTTTTTTSPGQRAANDHMRHPGASAASIAADEEGVQRAQEDKPIKIISSIIHREPASIGSTAALSPASPAGYASGVPAVVALLNSSRGDTLAPNGTMIHYHQPSPMQSDQVQAGPDSGTTGTQPTRQVLESTGSLLDKIEGSSASPTRTPLTLSSPPTATAAASTSTTPPPIHAGAANGTEGPSSGPARDAAASSGKL